MWSSSALVKTLFSVDRTINVENAGVTIAKFGQSQHGIRLARDSQLTCAVQVWSQQDCPEPLAWEEGEPAWIQLLYLQGLIDGVLFWCCWAFRWLPERCHLFAFPLIKSIFCLIVSHPLTAMLR